MPYLNSLVESQSISLAGYIPYARRVITKVLQPQSPEHACSRLETKLWRVITRSAPWTADEKWRIPRPRFDNEGNDDDLVQSCHPPGFEQETATIDEPAELTLWIELGPDLTKDPQCLIGMGLKGRWCYLKSHEAGQGWWTFKIKDCGFLMCLALIILSRASRFLAERPSTSDRTILVLRMRQECLCS